MFGKKKYKVQNTRRYKRMRAGGYLVKYNVAGTQEQPVVTHLKDLSAGGLKFWTERYLAEGTLLNVSFLVPALDLTVNALGRVVRVRPAKNLPISYVAVNFIELPNDAKKAVDAFVEDLSRLPQGSQLVAGGSVIKRTIIG